MPLPRLRIWFGTRLAPLLLAAALTLLCLPAPGQAQENAPLKVGLEDYYPPFALIDEEGRHSGFDHEIAEALCAAMQRPCELVVLPFEELLAAMRRGELDLVVDGLAASEERRQYMDFSDSYYRSRSIYIGPPGRVEISARGLRGKKLGAQKDTIQSRYAQSQWGDVAEVELDSYEGILDRLHAGELDAVLVDGLPGYAFLKSERGGSFELLADPMPPDLLFSYGHIGMRQHDDALREAVNKAIAQIRMNGEYDRISRKYFAFSIY